MRLLRVKWPMKWKWSHTINPKWEWFQYKVRLRPLYSIINIWVHSIVACFCCKNCSFHRSRLSVNALAGHSFEDQSTKTYCTINIVIPAIFSNGIGDILWMQQDARRIWRKSYHKRRSSMKLLCSGVWIVNAWMCQQKINASHHQWQAGRQAAAF